jgi:hypothetical protein
MVEGAVIVVSILLAFGIDTWWDARQARSANAVLIEALWVDFRTTSDRLDVVIGETEDVLARGRAYLDLAGARHGLSADSVRFLSSGVFYRVALRPATAALDGAITTGRLASIQSEALASAIADFTASLERFEQLADAMAADFYRGPSWEIRRAVGSLAVLQSDRESCMSGATCPYPSAFSMNALELTDLLLQPEVYAAVENKLTLYQNALRALRATQDSVGLVLRELEALR